MTISQDFTSTKVEGDALHVRELDGSYRAATNHEVIRAARRVLTARMRRGAALTSPGDAKDFLRVRLGELEHEVFAILFLDSQHRVLAFREMFRGTLAQTSVYPREVIKEALRLNAGAVILSHNHPSGMATPSRADEMLTQSLVAALRIIDVRVLDHLVIAGDAVSSFAELGLL